MAVRERRPLVEGLKSNPEVKRSLEEEFVHGNKAPPAAKHPTPAAAERTAGEGAGADSSMPPRPTGSPGKAKPQSLGRVPLTIRVRADLADLLKRASLERQLERIHPNTLQDIVEEALEPWLREHGYLP